MNCTCQIKQNTETRLLPHKARQPRINKTKLWPKTKHNKTSDNCCDMCRAIDSTTTVWTPCGNVSVVTSNIYPNSDLLMNFNKQKFQLSAALESVGLQDQGGEWWSWSSCYTSGCAVQQYDDLSSRPALKRDAVRPGSRRSEGWKEELEGCRLPRALRGRFSTVKASSYSLASQFKDSGSMSNLRRVPLIIWRNSSIWGWNWQ